MRFCTSKLMHLSGKDRFLFQTLPGNTGLCSSSSYREKCHQMPLERLETTQTSQETICNQKWGHIAGSHRCFSALRLSEHPIWQNDTMKWSASQILRIPWTNHSAHSQATVAEQYSEFTKGTCQQETATECWGCEKL